MQAEPQTEHEWLQKLVGEWTYESECSMGPDEPPSTFHGRETVRTLGGLWVICEGEGEMPGCTGQFIMTIGYDPQKKRYVGSWVGSMMANLWIYDGRLNAEETILTLDSEGPSFAGDGALSKYQDVIEFLDDAHRTLTSRMPAEDGEWTVFMTAHYRRKT